MPNHDAIIACTFVQGIFLMSSTTKSIKNKCQNMNAVQVCEVCNDNFRCDVQTGLHDNNVLRTLMHTGTWAFNDGPGWNSLQPKPGEFSEHVFQGLDYVVSACKKRGIRLLLSLVNYWSDYGGNCNNTGPMAYQHFPRNSSIMFHARPLRRCVLSIHTAARFDPPLHPSQAWTCTFDGAPQPAVERTSTQTLSANPCF